MNILRGIGAMAFACLFVGPALAADMPLDPLPELPPVQKAQSTGNWYLRGDIAYVMPKTTFDAPAAVPWASGTVAGGNYLNPNDWIWDTSDTVLANKDATNGWGFGGGIGYDFGMLRVDVTADHMFGAKVSADRIGFNYTDNFYRCEADAYCSAREGAKISRTTLMLNGYLDSPEWEGFTLYVGAGLGVAHHHLDMTTAQTCFGNQSSCEPDYPGLGNTVTSQTIKWKQAELGRWSPAVALMAGLSYKLTDHIDLDVGYRLMGFKDGKVSRAYTYIDNQPIGTLKLKNAYDQDVRAGLRYTFASQ
jgi:opacity protein-like surface antigen